MLIATMAGPVMPEAMNPIRFTVTIDRDETDENRDIGTTTVTGGRVEIDLVVPPGVDWEDEVDALAEAAQTFFHELALHAIPNANSMAAHGRMTETEEAQHARLHTPANAGNEHYQAMMRLLPHLPESIRAYFLGDYTFDVVGTAARKGPEAEAEAEAWVATMVDEAERLFPGIGQELEHH